MLVKFFQHGAVKKGQKGHSGGGGAVKNYLLGKNFDKGEIREGATLFRGDPNETTSIINGIERQSYYKSGVISFTENDSKKLSDDDLNAIIDDFEKTMFPTFEPDQYSGYWVKHTDKDRTELHFVYAEEELTSGYGLNVYVAKIDKPLVDSWKDLTNDKYELDDPNAPDHERERTVTKGFELKKGYEPKKTKIADEELKNQIEKEILEYVNNHPEITNRDGIISAFEALNYKVERQGKNYISIEHPEKKNNPDLKNLRFKSDIYSQDFNRSMLNKDKSYEQREYERKRPERIAKAQKIYDSSLQKRIERMTHRYRNIERKTLDNQLTHDLKQIQAKSEPNFLKQVAEYQRQQLKDIIGHTIEQIYKQHEHDQPEQLTSLKELHQVLIDDIDSRIQDEPLTQFDEIIANYQNSKNHIVTVDHIEHDRRQAELARQQAEQQRLQQEQFERALTEQSENLYCGETLPESEHQKLAELDDATLEYNKNHYLDEMIVLVEKSESELLTQAEIADFRAFERIVNSIHIIEQDRLEQQRELAQEQAQTADTAPESSKVRSDEEVAQPTPAPPPDLDQPEPEITLNQRQQIVYDIASKYFPNDDPDDMKEYVSSLSDSELRNIENPHQSSHDEYVRLANSYAQSLHDKATATAQAELAQLKKLIPTHPTELGLKGGAWQKAFDKWDIDRVLPQANVRNKEIQINDLKNQIVRATPLHFDKIAQNYPDLASNEQEYKQFEQFINEVNRALTELDRQQQPSREQEQVKKSGMDK